MEEDSNHSEEIMFIPESNIRSLEKRILAQIEKFAKMIPDTIFFETFDVCEEVKNQILNYEDEPLLSKTHNNYRRIVIASELFTGICSIFELVVDYEYSKIINEIIQQEKYEKLSKIITHKLKLQQKMQKYYAKEAQSKLVKSLKDAEKQTLDDREDLIKDTEISKRGPVENGKPVPKPIEYEEQELQAVELIQQQPGLTEVDQIVEKPAQTETLSKFETELSSAKRKLVDAPKATELPETLDDIVSYIHEMRAEITTDISHLQYSISSITRPDITLPDTLAGVSIEDVRPQLEMDDDIKQILKVLEDKKAVGEIEQPELPKVIDKTLVEGLPIEKQADVLEESEEWTLPELKPVKSITKHRHLKIDQNTIIHGYAAKAVQLNRNITVQRVQVFEGPPKILQAMSVNYLMKTPGYKKSIFQDVRSSRLIKIYERHLEVEKKPVETMVLKTRETERKEVDISKARINVDDVTEEFAIPLGMHSELEKSDIIVEVPVPDKIPEDIAFRPHPRDSLIGVPISKIINGTVEAPKTQMDRIHAVPELPVSRVQELQGKSLEPKMSPPWFFSTKENPPSEKYREFNYVYNKLQEYWLLFDGQGRKKCISLRDFLSFEGDNSVQNFLTVLRIVDKMSIQRKLVLEYKNNDVLIRPFEIPYVSESQILLKGKKPVL